MTATAMPSGAEDALDDGIVYSVGVVIPVFQGELTLDAVIDELAPLALEQRTPAGHRYSLGEVVLVHDGAIDRSDVVMRRLAAQHDFVHLVWLSRNFGQHAATIAGMASTSAAWVVTIDEDGQQDPADIARLLDAALAADAQLVYAQPTNPPPHGWWRNTASALVKWLFVKVMGNGQLGRFNSFRLVRGDIARGLAAYCGQRVYLDVAFTWVVAQAVHCPVALREERGRRSGYALRRLVGHFWQLVLTSGTRPLRFLALLGTAFMAAGIIGSIFVLHQKLTAGVPVAGWASMVVLVALSSGFILFALGIIAEYVGIAVSMAMGKPLYLIVSDGQRRR